MSRFCPVSLRRVVKGHNVSHANNKTKRPFFPNLQQFSFASEVLKRVILLRLSVRGMRIIENAGGFDAYLAKTKKTQLDKSLHPYKKAFDTQKSKTA